MFRLSTIDGHVFLRLLQAAILQQTAEYIYQLEQEKTRLLSQNCQLKRLLNQQHHSDPEGIAIIHLHANTAVKEYRNELNLGFVKEHFFFVHTSNC